MPTSSALIYTLDDGQRVALERSADAGDAEAAFRLSQHYTFASSDADRRLHWLGVAARHGHGIAQYNLAHELSADGRDLSQAARWAAEAHRHAVPGADRLLQRIETLRSVVPGQTGVE